MTPAPETDHAGWDPVEEILGAVDIAIDDDGGVELVSIDAALSRPSIEAIVQRVREQARAVEKEACAKLADQRAAEAREQIAENNAYLAEQGLWSDSHANRLCQHSIDVASGLAAAIRART